jgi:coatomer protein complex subunit gamma
LCTSALQVDGAITVFLSLSLSPSLLLSPSDAVGQIINFMGMQPCERSDKVDPNKPGHTLLLAGVYRGGHDVLVRARLAHSQAVTMKITIRGDDIIACETIAAAVG